jgi:hypothetical protein
LKANIPDVLDQDTAMGMIDGLTPMILSVKQFEVIPHEGGIH